MPNGVRLEMGRLLRATMEASEARMASVLKSLETNGLRLANYKSLTYDNGAA